MDHKMISIRKAITSDAAAIAKVHVESWQVTYRGHIPDEILDNLSVNEREKLWKSLLENNTCVFVLEEDHHLIGFVSMCASRDNDADPTQVGEISAIYIHPDKWRKGHGKLLLDTAINELIKLGYHEVSLWVLDSNQSAIRFYENVGFSKTSAVKVETKSTYNLNEVRYRRQIP